VATGMRHRALANAPATATPRVLGSVTRRENPPVPLRLRAARALREGGVGHILMWVLRKICTPMVDFGSLAFFARELDGGLPRPEAASGISVGWALPGEIDRLVAGYDGARSAATLRERFRNADRCIVALDDHGEVVHCRWVALRYAYSPECGMDLVLGPGEAYFYDGYTRREARGRGIDGAVRSFIFHSLRAEGFQRVYSFVRGDNPVGLKAARRRQRPMQRLWYIRLCRLTPLVIGKRALGPSTFLAPGIPQDAQATASAGRD